MPTLAEVRQQYPQYGDLSDRQLADSLYKKFYSDIPREQFNEKVGIKPEKSIGERVQEVWDKPTPGGIPWLLKQGLEGMTGSVAASAGAVQNPTTEAGAFLQNQGRDFGPALATQAAAITGPLAPGGKFGGATAPSVRAMLPEPAPQIKSPLLEAAGNIGVDIPQYLATESMPVQRLASGVKNIPVSGDKIVKSAQAVNEGLGEAARGVAEGFGAGSVDVAGGAAKDAMSQWIKSGSARPLNEAYKEVDALISPEVRGPLNKTAEEVSKIMAERANAKIGGKSGAVNTVLPAIQSDGMNYEGAKALRSFLGERTPQELIAEGINPKEARRLYKALSGDLEEIVTTAGGDQAKQLWKEANALNVQTMGERKSLAKIIGIKGDAAPEAVYSKLVSYAGSKSSADISRLMLARKAMGEDAWNEVASATVARLGRDAQGNFTPDRFSTAYGSLSPQGKSALFGGKSDLAKSLDDINTVVTAIKDKIGKFANTSGTTQTSFGAGMIGGAVMDPVSLIASIVGGKAVAEMLSKPATAKATADFAKAYQAALEKPSESRRLMVNVASRSLASSVGQNVKMVDVKTFLNLLQGSVPATADDKKNK